MTPRNLVACLLLGAAGAFWGHGGLTDNPAEFLIGVSLLAVALLLLEDPRR